jgi:hypothetical protein
VGGAVKLLCVAPPSTGQWRKLTAILGADVVAESRHVQVCYGIEEQRREMVTAIRAITDHVASQINKSTLDKRVLEAMAKVPRHEFVPVEVQLYATKCACSSSRHR